MPVIKLVLSSLANLNLLKMRVFRFLFALLLLLKIVPVNAQSYSEIVDPRIGSEGNGLGCGYNFIGACYPFGMVQFTPTFFTPQRGFVINQLNGAGCAHMGNFPVLPINGELKDSPNDMNGFTKYDKIDKAYAGYLSVNMNDNTNIELTVNKRSGIARFTFDGKSTKGTILIGSGISSTFITNAMVKITSNSSCEGFAEGGEFCGTNTNYRVYFAAEFDQPAISSGTWKNKTILKSGKKAFGKNSGTYFTFSLNGNKEVNYRIAISYVSIENAKLNLKSDYISNSFDDYKKNAEGVWNENLGKIAVKSDDSDRIKQFYTHFYHTLIHPNIVSDVNGEYMGADFVVHKTKNRNYYSSFSVWDTYRTQCQLVAMLYPKEASDMMQSVVDFAEQSGGYGRWVLANIETGIMQGDPTSILVANSYAFGAKDFDLQKAFYHMKNGATTPFLRSQDQLIRPQLSEYMKNGFNPHASMMLEYTSADYAIGQFAKQAINDEKEAAYFINRAQNWKNLYNSKLNWLCSRETNGDWKDIEHDWREASYKNYFWMVPYDLKSLIDTIGGNNFAEKRLDTLFTRLDASYEDDWFAAGNEPDFQVPWVYNWTNSPHKTSEVIHRIINEIYNSSPSGLPGNDDLGAMGAWYVYASIGLYPMVPGVGGFSINKPQFEEIKIKLPKGELVILGGSMEKSFIKSLKLNGKIHKSTWVNWPKLENGGKLEYKTSKKVDKKWAASLEPLNN